MGNHYRVAMKIAFGVSVVLSETKASAQTPHGGKSSSSQLAEASYEACAATLKSAYGDLHARVQILTETIEANKYGQWKVLRNFVLPDLKALEVPAFQDARGNTTKISQFKTSGAFGGRRITSFESSTEFGKSRWSLTAGEARKLCGEGLETHYKIPALSGYSQDPKRSVEATIRSDVDLAELKTSLQITRDKHVQGKSIDKGHREVYIQISEMIEVIEKTQRLTQKIVRD